MSDIMLCGFWAHATTEAAEVLLAADPALRPARHHDTRDLARTLRMVSSQGGPDRLVILPEADEPDQIRTAWPAPDAGCPPVDSSMSVKWSV